ncbi:MAG: class II aldolase/adducin family protein, partial [Bacteroidota bacterium]
MTDARGKRKRRREGAAHLAALCRRLHAAGMTAATDGNVSMRTPRGTILITRSGIPKERVRAADLVELSPRGRKLRGQGRPSTEAGMHLFIYRRRPDVMAVVHAHPVYATAYAVARVSPEENVLPEVIAGLGRIPLAPYATPSTGEVAASLGRWVTQSQAVILANHGAVTWGGSLEEAWYRMEKLEHAARILWTARMLGGARPLSTAQV